MTHKKKEDSYENSKSSSGLSILHFEEIKSVQAAFICLVSSLSMQSLRKRACKDRQLFSCANSLGSHSVPKSFYEVWECVSLGPGCFEWAGLSGNVRLICLVRSGSGQPRCFLAEFSTSLTKRRRNGQQLQSTASALLKEDMD